MSEKRLWHVTLSDDLIVFAESAAEAERIAMGERWNAQIEVERVAEMDHFPGEWDEDAVPVGADTTIGELVARGAAPELTAMRERIAALKGKAT